VSRRRWRARGETPGEASLRDEETPRAPGPLIADACIAVLLKASTHPLRRFLATPPRERRRVVETREPERVCSTLALMKDGYE